MKKILLMAMTAIVLMACGDQNGPDKTGPLSQKDKDALEYIGKHSRGLMGKSETVVTDAIVQAGFTLEEPPSKAPRRAKDNLLDSHTTWRFYLNAPEIANWRGVYNEITESELQALDKVFGDGKVYAEVEAEFYAGLFGSITVKFYSNSNMQKVNDVLLAISEGVQADLSSENIHTWKGRSQTPDKQEKSFTTWEEMKAFLDDNSHVYSYQDGSVTFDRDSETRTYNFEIDWEDLATQLEEAPSLSQYVLVRGEFTSYD